MRAKTVITIAFFSAVWFILCEGQSLRAQATPAAPAAGASIQDSTNDLSVAVGKTVLVDTAQPISRVAIGLADTAEVSGISPTEVMVTGKAAGETSLIIWDIHGGRQFFNVTVHAVPAVSSDNLDTIRRELRTELPGQTVKATFENNSVFLRGTVNDLNSSSRAVQIAGTAGKVVNLLSVNVPASDPQILLKVRFASVDRTLEKQLGLNLFNLGEGNAVGGITTGQFSPPTISGAGGTASSSGGSTSASGGVASFTNEMNLLAFFPGLKSGADIEAVETKGLVELLAEPNLLAANGKEASFLAGGEYPYPVAQGSAGTVTISIQFKEYGVRLNFIPTITPRGTIRLQVAPEVSTLDFSNAITLDGFVVPAIDSRKVNTEVELRDRQTFVIGGLLDNTETETFEKVPFIGDIPILGKLFQSIQRTKNNTELLISVTPEIVAPIPAGQPVPALNYPVKYLPPNSNIPMHQPDAQSAETAQPPAPATLPVEQLIDSMKPEKPLIVEGASGAFGGATTSMNGAGTVGAGASPQ